MKKMRQLCILLMICNGICFADDTSISVAGGSPGIATMIKSEQIEMISEIVIITINEDYYTVDTDFELFNNGEAMDVSIAFPQWQWGTRELGEFKSFEALTNGEPEEYQIMSATKEQENNEIKINKWFVRTIHFKGKETKHTSVKYTAVNDYGTISYLFGTGSNWKGEINKVTFVIINNSGWWINEVSLDGYIDYTRIYEPEFEISSVKNLNVSVIDNITTIVLEHVCPTLFDSLYLFMKYVPRGIVSNKYIKPNEGWYYSETIIPKWILLFRTDDQLRLERNLIFAGHGNIFVSKDINEWLENCCSDFYKPIRKISIEDLNENEKENVRIIQTEEKRRNVTS